MQPGTVNLSVTGLVTLSANNVSHHMGPSDEIMTVSIEAKHAQDCPLQSPDFTILNARLNEEKQQLEFDVAYTYRGGLGPNLKAYSDFARKNDGTQVHIYLCRETPTGLLIKGHYCKSTIQMALENPCFLSPTTIHLHYRETTLSASHTIIVSKTN